MDPKRDIKQIKETDFNVVLNYRGEISTIRRKSVRESLNCYIAVVKMGHTGNGYEMAKVVSVLAKDYEEFKRRVACIPRTKRDKVGFILSSTMGSVKEGKFVRMINDYDPFINGTNIGTESQIVISDRMISSKSLEYKLEEQRRNGLTDFEYKSADEYAEKDVIQKAYAPYLIESGDENNRTVRVAKSDKPLEGQLLYDYFKQNAIRFVKKYNVVPRDRFQALLYYARILPKYKKYVKIDSEPFRVFFEKLEPNDDRKVVEIRFLYKDRENGNQYYEQYSHRTLGTEQYALCYRNLSGEKISLLVPDDFVCSVVKHPSKEDVETYVSNKISDNERLQKYDKNYIGELTYKALSEEKLDTSDLDSNTAILVKEMASHFSDFEFSQGLRGIRKVKWENNFDGEFMGEDFYEQEKSSIDSVTDKEYEDFMKKRNSQMMAKFQKFKNSQQTKNPEPGEEE